jgi:hypothetical protein
MRRAGIGNVRWTACIVALFAIGAGLLALNDRELESGGDVDSSATWGVPTADPSGAAIVNPFSALSRGVATVFEHGDQPRDPLPDASTVLDASQDLHIAESQRNYRAFLARPDGYSKYEALAAVHPQDITGLEQLVYDQHLSYHGRLAVEELRYQVSTSPLDHAGNADRLVRMLDIIAKAPCPPDEHWSGCIGQSLGITRADVEKAQADVSILRDQRNLAQARALLAERSSGAQLPVALYESLTPLLVRSLDGDEDAVKRFGLAAEEASDIVTTINEQLSGEPPKSARDIPGTAAPLKP